MTNLKEALKTIPTIKAGIELEKISCGPLGIIDRIHILILSFSTESKTCSVYYKVNSDTDKLISEGNLTINEELFSKWGFDNKIIEDFVIDTLNLKRL
jgi:hypothetical protein